MWNCCEEIFFVERLASLCDISLVTELIQTTAASSETAGEMLMRREAVVK